MGTWLLWGGVLACSNSLAATAMSRARLAKASLQAGALLALVGTLLLTFLLLTGDFSVDYVVRTTSLATPWPYRLAALWGAMEGSLLFYATVTVGFGVLALGRISEDSAAMARPVVALVGGGLLALTGLMADPFLTLPIPAVDGEGLVAILQHPAMVYHPPILYFGLTSLLVPFAITASALWRRAIDRSWIVLTRRWLLVSWTFLTIGMVAGANWAYVELGWGGFWAWDPVENTSLMPWLAATAFLHTSRIQLRDGRLARWNVAFAMLPFLLTVLGIYLTRSGVTGSVHAFAESQEIGRILLSLFIVFVVISASALTRVDKGPQWKLVSPLSRDTWLAGNGGLLGMALTFVFIGSAYPAYLAVFGDARSSIDPGFFVTLVLPISFLLLIGLALGLETRWDAGHDMSTHTGTFAGLSALGLILGGTSFGWSWDWGLLLLAIALGTVARLVLAMIRNRPSGRMLVGHLAHLGMAVVLIGAGGSSLGDEFRGGMAPGDIVSVGGYEVRLDSIETGDESRFVFVDAELSLIKGGVVVETVNPQIRAYEEQDLPVPEPVLRSTPREDIVFAISRVTQDASGVEVNVFVRPLVFWVWVGGLLIGLSGLLALFSRVAGDEERRRLATTAPPAPEATTAR